MTRTTRRLLLMRHAKTADAPDLADIDRPLVPTGERDAGAVGEWLHSSGIVPHLVLCSPAERARRTWAATAEWLAPSPAVEHVPDIYQADDITLLELLRTVDDAVDTLLVVGHNPAVQRLAYDLSGADELARGFPAGSVAMLSVPGSWAELAVGALSLTAFASPANR